MAFRVGASTKLDERVITLEELKTLPLAHLLMRVYPHLYPVHMLDEKVGIIQCTLPLAHLLMRVYPHLYPVHMLDEKVGIIRCTTRLSCIIVLSSKYTGGVMSNSMYACLVRCISELFTYYDIYFMTSTAYLYLLVDTCRWFPGSVPR